MVESGPDRKRRVSLVCLLLLSVLFPVAAQADIVIQGSSDFRAKVRYCLQDAKGSSATLRKLVNAARHSSSDISIRAITDDRATWHASGKKSRSHTEADDKLARGSQRDRPVDAIIYINVKRITPSHKSYKSGVLVHELAHAVDLAEGRYHGDYRIREKRAVFFQNDWRKNHGKALRKDYHGRFSTQEYQQYSAKGRVNDFVEYYLKNNDLPG